MKRTRRKACPDCGQLLAARNMRVWRNNLARHKAQVRRDHGLFSQVHGYLKERLA